MPDELVPPNRSGWLPLLITHLVFRLPDFVYRDVTIILVGAMANWILFGILWVQVYLYYITFPKDNRFLRLTVFLELLLETIQTTAVTHDVFRFFTIGFTNPIVINQVGTAWYSVPLMSGLIASLSQGFYCYRAAVLTRSKYAVGIISMLSMCQLGAAISVAVQTKHANLLTKVLGTEISLITIGIWGTSGLTCDVMIAVIMTYYLKKRDTGFKETHNLVKRLIRLSIETGSITASLAGISLALVYLPGHPPYYQIAALILAKTYSNSMVAALNSRVKVVSNSPTGSPPSWNESQKPVVLFHTARSHQSIMFRREEDTATSSAYTV